MISPAYIRRTLDEIFWRMKMNTARIYKDIDGNDRSIHYMVKHEPQWAANRIQVGEDALNSLQKLKSEILPLIERGIVATDAKCIGTANYLFREIQAKLLAV